ncbi:MAG TPA: protease HtpX [Candidatus Saccharimonadia bacterium]|nr:protease HtpX [Candidatus Saccharimonadia bacterium]
MMRIALLIATNLAVVLLLGLVLTVLESVFGIRLGQDTGGLLVMAAVLGMGGAFISLAISKWMAKRATGARVITQPGNEHEVWLVATVKRQAEAAGIGMPEVAIYDAPEMNAFATGMNKNNALVAVSTGLLRGMERREVEAVLGHEISHVANGDMITLTLIQGVVNTFVIFLARIVGSIVDSALRGNRGGSGGIGYFVTVMVAQVVLGVFASMIVAWFSRRREFRADAGGAKLEGRDAMAAALARLGGNPAPTTLPKEVQAFGISGKIGNLFATHPPLEERIAALRAST